MLESEEVTTKQDDKKNEIPDQNNPPILENEFVKEVRDIAEKIAEGEGKIKKNRHDRKQYTIILFVLIIVDIAIYFFRWLINNQITFEVVFWIIAFFAFILGVAALGAQNFIISAQTDIDVLNSRLRVLSLLSGNTQQSQTSSYFDSLVRINVENLSTYYALVKVHTDKSFMVSIIVGIIGFVLIGIGLSVAFATNAQSIAYIGSASGIITEFIAAIFFYLYNRTVRQMKGYHDSLLVVQNILLSFKLVEDTKDESEKAKMVNQMLAYLVGRQGLPFGTLETSTK